jgi:hypothetical protein
MLAFSVHDFFLVLVEEKLQLWQGGRLFSRWMLKFLFNSPRIGIDTDSYISFLDRKVSESALSNDDREDLSMDTTYNES